jgi:hypothetical protein
MAAEWPLARVLVRGACVAMLAGIAGPALAQAPPVRSQSDEAAIVKLSNELRAPGSTGKWKEVGVDAGKAQISTVPRLRLDERAVPASARPPGSELGPDRVDWRRLQGEVSQRFGELEACRNKVARQGKVAVEDVRAGLVVLRWTILPTGRISGTAVYQQRETELPLLRCIQARMESWRFTPPSSDPVTIEQTYDFAAALAASREAAAARATPAAAQTPAPNQAR